MGQFAAALKNAMDRMGWDQLDLVDKLERVSQSSLSRYLVSNDLPKAGTLELICKNLPEDLCEDVAAAYLTDQIPPSASELVVVTTTRESKAKSPRYLPGRAAPGSTLRRDLDSLERRALNDQNLAMALNYLAASFRHSKPSVRPHDPSLEGWSVSDDPAVAAARKNLDEEERRNQSSEK